MRRAILVGSVAVAAVVAGATVATAELPRQNDLDRRITSPPPASIGTSSSAAVSPGPMTSLAPTSASTSSPRRAENPAPPRPVLAEVVTNGPRTANKVALTFDADLSDWTLTRVRDGRYPEQVNTEVMEVLETTRTPATVFVTGLWAQEYPWAMARIAANPRLELANHTFNHDAWTGKCYGLPQVEGPVAKAAEVNRTAAIIRSYSGTAPAYFRFPGLCHDPADVDIVAALGETPVDVDVETSDAFARDSTRVVEGILSEIKPGSIVLFHLNGAPNAPATAQIVRELLPALAERGLAPVTLAELLRLP